MDEPERAFLQRKYELDRLHELELNKFTHAFELEQAKLLFILNGAAFTVLLALMETGGTGRDPGLLHLAAMLWLMGLVAAVVAGRLALGAQLEFTRAYHNRRRATETTFGVGDVIENGVPLSRAHHLQRADDARDVGQQLAKWTPRAAYGSVMCFVGGAVAALVWLRSAI
jgi:hypothetical protein